jgi:Ca2+-binding EF-hand superfamily protein
MASIICRVSAQFTQNVFLRLDHQQRGYLDQATLEQALVGLSQQEVRQLLLTLDQDGDQRISPHELHLAILDWLSEANTTPMPTAFSSLLVLYGLEDEQLNTDMTPDVRRHTASDHSYARMSYVR